MAKIFQRFLKDLNNFTVRNAPSGGKSSGGGGLGGSFNRDPKATQVKRVGYQLSNSPGGGGGRDSFEGPEADFEQVTEAIKRDSYLSQAVMKYTELIFKSGYSIVGKNEQALEYLKMRLMMMGIATAQPTEELWTGIAEDIVRYSNCFLVKARAKGGVGLAPGLQALAIPPAKEPVAGYFRLPPQTIEISRDQNGLVKKYKQEIPGGGDAKEFAPHDVVHIKVNVPSGKPFGDPFLAPVIEDVRLLRKVEENAALLLYRHIFPLLSYTVGIDKPGYEATDEELADLRAIIEDMPTDGAIVLPERHKIEAVKVDAIDGKPYLEYFENRVFSGMGLSQVDFGRGDTANRNTADAMTGIKADRVKGWQQAIQLQIDKYIIEEILVEGGFDPIVNAEFDCDFVFNEIELERKIAKESHAIFKFNNNATSWEEMREEIGEDPVTDEARLKFQMIDMVMAEQQAALKPASGEAENKNKPANQHGSKSGPKKKTESIQEKVFNRSETKYAGLSQELTEFFKRVEEETMDALERKQKRNPSSTITAKELLSSAYLGKRDMSRAINTKAESIFSEGVRNAKSDTKNGRYPKFNTGLALQTIRSYTEDSMESLQKQLRESLEKRLEKTDDTKEQALAVRSTFEALKFKMRLLSKTILARSYNYGYALSLVQYEEKTAEVTPDDEACPTCQEKAADLISLKQLSSLDEVAIFYRIPPWHPNCECEMKANQGGEN